MKKAAAKDKPTTTSEDIEQYLTVFDARRQFIATTMNMSWRLAVTVLVPILGGVWLDNRYHTSPSWMLVGFFVAIIGGVSAVWSTVMDLNKEQVESEKDNKENKPSAK